MELLAEAGNVAALQRIYGGSGVPWPYPGMTGLAPPPAVPPPLSAAYYSQLAAIQKPLAYRVFPPLGLGAAAAAAPAAAASAPSSLAPPPAAALSDRPTHHPTCTRGSGVRAAEGGWLARGRLVSVANYSAHPSSSERPAPRMGISAMPAVPGSV